jgi:hypothetical protein
MQFWFVSVVLNILTLSHFQRIYYLSLKYTFFTLVSETGWVCYAEKTHGNFILPHISTTKSPQQIMGSLVKYHLACQMGRTADSVYHITLMPCYDKKLEASREDFFNKQLQTRDVDCVITAGEQCVICIWCAEQLITKADPHVGAAIWEALAVMVGKYAGTEECETWNIANKT